MLYERCSLFRSVRRILSGLAVVWRRRNSWRGHRAHRLCQYRACQHIALPARRLHSDWCDDRRSGLARRLRTLKMETAGKTGTTMRGRLISIVIVAFAVALALYALHESNTHPTSSDSSIDADVVHVAAAVGGRIIQLPVVENMLVAESSLLFQIDPLPYHLALEQVAADLGIARSNAAVAVDQTKSAQEDRDLAARTLARLRPLASNGYVPQQQLDQAQVLEKDTATKLIQAQELKASAEATVRARTAALGIAQRQLDDTTVRATHNGLVVG